MPRVEFGNQGFNATCSNDTRLRLISEVGSRPGQCCLCVHPVQGGSCKTWYTPSDGTPTCINFSGHTGNITAWEAANGLSQPIDGYPTGTVAVIGGSKFANGSGLGLGYFGLNSNEHRWHLYCHYSGSAEGHIFGAATPKAVNLSAQMIGSPHHLTMDFGRLDQPVCFRQGTGGVQDSGYSYTTYSADPATELFFDNCIASAGVYLINYKTRLYCKGVSGPSRHPDDPWPKTYAEIDANHVVFDAIVDVYHHDTAGFLPVDIVGMPNSATTKKDTTNWSPDYTLPYTYAEALTGKTFHDQPGGGSMVSASFANHAMWRPNIHGTSPTYHNAALENTRVMRERFQYGPVAGFQDGKCYFGVAAQAEWDLTQQGYEALSGLGGNGVLAGAILPNVPEPATGPMKVQQYNTFGFATYSIEADAEWNDGLEFGKLKTAPHEKEKTIPCFAIDATPFVDPATDPLGDNGGESVPEEAHTGFTHLDKFYAPCGILLPLRLVNWTITPTAYAVSFPGAFSRPALINTGGDTMGWSTASTVWQSAVVPNSTWQNPANFTEAMPESASSVPVASGQQYGPGVHGYLVQNAGSGNPQAVISIAPSGAGYFTREVC